MVGWGRVVGPRQLDVLVTSSSVDVAAGDEVLCQNDLDLHQRRAGGYERSSLLVGSRSQGTSEPWSVTSSHVRSWVNRAHFLMTS